MARRSQFMLIVGALVLWLGPTPGMAQTAREEAGSPPAYRPGLGDLMTATVQPRHIKLALSARERNWAYAAYELHQLQEAFDRTAQVWPTWRGVPIADMIKSVTTEPMAVLTQAIKSGDPERFASGYGLLTDAWDFRPVKP